MKHYSVAEPSISNLEKKYVNECLNSGWISSQGKFVDKFEGDYAKFNNTKYAVATSNGTVSLHLILLALGLSNSDEIIVPNFTYIATVNAVLYAGAKPVLVDCDAETYNIDPAKIEEKITNKTKAVIVTHLYGNPCQMDEILKISKKYKLHLIEDAAEAHGATFKNKIVGSFGIANSFSFFGNKTISTGEGGMITTNNKKVFEKIKLLKNQGQHSKDKRYYHRILGYNYRLTNIQSAIGCAQISKINYFIEKKKKINSWYRKQLVLAEKSGKIKFHKETSGSSSSWWMTALTIENGDVKKISNNLKKYGIETRPFFVPMNKIPYIKSDEQFPNSEMIYNHGIILPSGTNLKKKDIEFISNKLLLNLK